MIATMRRVNGKEQTVRVVRAIGDAYYYLVDFLDGRVPLLVRYDRLRTGSVPLKGPKATA